MDDYNTVRITWDNHYYEFNIVYIITKKYYVCKHPDHNSYATFTYNEDTKVYENINDQEHKYLVTMHKKNL